MDCTRSVLTVICTDAYTVKILFISEKLFVAVIESYVFKAVLCSKLFSLTGDKVSHCNDLNIGHLLICNGVFACNPACADDTYFNFSACALNFFCCYLIWIKVCI